MTSLSTGATAPAAEHRTVARAMSILELVLASDRQGMRLGELAAAIDAPKSSVHGLAKGLVAAGYFREEGGRYFTGPAISALIAVGPAALPSVYRHLLQELSRRWGETTMLGTLVGDSIVYLDCVESKALIRAAPELNKRLPLWPRSGGKCFLAFMEPRRRDAYLRRVEPDPVYAEDARRELEVVRETRVGVNIGGSIADHIAIASPITDGSAPVAVAVVIAGPKSRMQDHVDEIANSVRSAVDSLFSS